ncbi:MAG: hypothetical protein AAB642_01340 [Patescibacteria group bacterium]
MSKEKKKRYTLVLPDELFEQLQQVATDRDTTVVAILRQFIKLGLLAVQLKKSDSAALLFREGETEQRIRLF